MIIKNNNTFHLQGKNISYVMAVNSAGDLLHIHYGKKLLGHDYSSVGHGWNAWEADCPDGWSLDICQQEYPSYGYTDLRTPAFSVVNGSANNVNVLKYKGYELLEDFIPNLTGLPCLFKGNKTAQTLKITLADVLTGLEVALYYSVFDDCNVILRHAVLINNSDAEMSIEQAYSANLDLVKGNYDLLYLPGAWARERELVRQELNQGTVTDISNARGGSGHSMNPFVMIAEQDANEDYGKVYSMSLVYSGNHSTRTESDQYGNIRVHQGINPSTFRWNLAPGESFTTPQCVLAFSSDGVGGISRELNHLYRTNLCRSKWVDKPRPILINNWEATYFDFNEEKLLQIAKRASEAGIELFVLDDGWFGKRNNDKCSLGDWYVNTDKLPNGIDGLADKINALGLKFGLWIEPEMISPDSDLYRAHPDWAIKIDRRPPALSRTQLILDLSKDEVCDYVINTLLNLLTSANISYVKWDMNRNMTDMPSLGYNHKYMLGFYRVISTLTERLPNILFEGCSGGGGRFDAGILAYVPQIWTSDNTDAISRLKIQYSTSIAYPPSSISAHVTAVPNHQNGRATNLKTRFDTALMGAFGYELDITKLSDDDFEQICHQVKLVKSLRSLLQNGTFYRLRSPYDTNYCAWEFASDKEALVFICKILSDANCHEEPIYLKALKPNSTYVDEFTGKKYYGDDLTYIGYTPDFPKEDFTTIVMHLKEQSNG